MQQYLSRFEVAVIVGALGLLVVGVSLIAVPNQSPTPTTHVDGVYHAQLSSPAPLAPEAAATTPLPNTDGASAANPGLTGQATSPIVASGPTEIHLWRTGVYYITFTVDGTQPAAIWWSGVRMQNWTWQLVDGHCEMTPAQDRLEGTIVGGRAVIELDLTPMRTGQLVIEGSVNGGQPLGLTVVQVS